MNDSAVISVAARYGIPPAILNAALQVGGGLPDHVAYNYGVDPNNEWMVLEAAARTLTQSFQQSGTWDRALAVYYGGDQNAVNSPTSTIAGQVAATLGVSALNPTLGMDEFGRGGADPMAMQTFNDFGNQLQSMSQSGGMVNQGLLGSFQQKAQWLFSEMSQQAQQTDPRAADPNANVTYDSSGQVVGTAGSGSRAGAGGQYAASPANILLQADPFGKGAQPPEISQPFGEKGEQGADYSWGRTEGHPVFSGFDGTVHIAHYGSAYTGLSVWVDNGKGWQFFVGHLQKLPDGITEGMQVHAGDLLAYSGGGPASPEPGHSTGPHIEIQIRRETGPNQYQFYNPADIVQMAANGQLDPGSEVVQAAHSAANQQATASSMRDQAAGEQKLQRENSPDPQQVSAFKMQANAAGITDPQHLIDHMPLLGPLFRSLHGIGPTLEEVAKTQGMDQSQMLEWFHAQPDKTYPWLTNGQIRQKYDQATLYSTRYAQRMPTKAEVSRLIQANAGDKDLTNYYAPQTDTVLNPPEQQPGTGGNNVVKLPQGGDKVGMRAS